MGAYRGALIVFLLGVEGCKACKRCWGLFATDGREQEIDVVGLEKGEHISKK